MLTEIKLTNKMVMSATEVLKQFVDVYPRDSRVSDVLEVIDALEEADRIVIE